MKYLMFLLIVVTYCFSCIAQAPNKVSLLVEHCKSDEGLCQTQQVSALRFENGKFVNKELLISIDSDKLSLRNTNNFVYKNKFIISGWGHVIDIEKKKILHKSTGQFNRIDINNDIIYIRERNDRKNGLFSYDINKRKYKKLNKINSEMGLGELSSTGKRSAWHYCSYNDEGKFCGIEILEVNKEKKFFKGNFDVRVIPDELSSEMLKVPVLWIDDETILTQKSNGNLVTIDMNGEVKPFLKIDIKSLPDGYPKLYQGFDGKIYYWCVEKYELNIKDKTYKKISSNNLEYEFTTDTRENYWSTYYFQNQKIGRLWASNPITTKGYLAVLYADDDENMGYPEGVKVWNEVSEQWSVIEIDWGADIIGWVID